MVNRTLKSFVPSYYTDIVEMNDIMEAEENLMTVARQEMVTAFSNTFVLTADVNGISMFESMLSIVANPSQEDLEFRRQRILNRMSTSPPFTFRFLQRKLDEIIGPGSWTAYIDFNNYTLYVESSATNQNWYSEIEFTINRIKPCNIVFVNVPRSSESLKISEEVSYGTLLWKYRLSSWKLGQNPFTTMEGGGVIKMPEIRSVQSSLLTSVASSIVNEVASVLINNSVTITDFSIKQVSGNSALIQYTVSPNMASVITDIKLRRADGTVLTQSSVYVPVTQTVMNKHIISVKEGV